MKVITLTEFKVIRRKKFLDHLKRRKDELAASGSSHAARFLDERIQEQETDNPYATRLANKAKTLRQAGEHTEAMRLEAKASAFRRKSPLPLTKIREKEQ